MKMSERAHLLSGMGMKCYLDEGDQAPEYFSD